MTAKRRALGAVGLLVLAAAIYFFIRGADPPAATLPRAAAPSGEDPSIPDGQTVQADAAPLESATDPALPPPVDLDAADRDLDLFGRVVDAEGAPVAGARIECIERPGWRTPLLDSEAFEERIIDATVLSAADGTFSFRRCRGDQEVPVGTCEVGTRGGAGSAGRGGRRPRASK